MERSFDLCCRLTVGAKKGKFWPEMDNDPCAHKFLVDLAHDPKFLTQLSSYLCDEHLVSEVTTSVKAVLEDTHIMFQVRCKSDYTARVIRKTIYNSLLHYLRGGGIAQLSSFVRLYFFVPLCVRYPVNGGEVNIHIVSSAFEMDDPSFIDLIEIRRKCQNCHHDSFAYWYTQKTFVFVFGP